MARPRPCGSVACENPPWRPCRVFDRCSLGRSLWRPRGSSKGAGLARLGRSTRGRRLLYHFIQSLSLPVMTFLLFAAIFAAAETGTEIEASAAAGRRGPRSRIDGDSGARAAGTAHRLYLLHGGGPLRRAAAAGAGRGERHRQHGQFRAHAAAGGPGADPRSPAALYVAATGPSASPTRETSCRPTSRNRRSCRRRCGRRRWR